MESVREVRVSVRERAFVPSCVGFMRLCSVKY